MGTFSQYQYPHTRERYAECARFCGIQAKDDAEAVQKLIVKIESLRGLWASSPASRITALMRKDFLDRLDDMVEQHLMTSVPALTQDIRL